MPNLPGNPSPRELAAADQKVKLAADLVDRLIVAALADQGADPVANVINGAVRVVDCAADVVARDEDVLPAVAVVAAEAIRRIAQHGIDAARGAQDA